MRPSRCLATTALARSGGVPQTPSAAWWGGHSCPPSVRFCPAEPQSGGHSCPPSLLTSAEFRGLARIDQPAWPPALLPLPPSLVKQLAVGFLPPVTFITPVRPITYGNIALPRSPARSSLYDNFFISPSINSFNKER